MNPPVRVLLRSDETQIRLSWLSTIGVEGGLDVRLHRKSESEVDAFEAYCPTSAGLVIPRGQLRDFAALVLDLAAEIER